MHIKLLLSIAFTENFVMHVQLFLIFKRLDDVLENDENINYIENCENFMYTGIPGYLC